MLHLRPVACEAFDKKKRVDGMVHVQIALAACLLHCQLIAFEIFGGEAEEK